MRIFVNDLSYVGTARRAVKQFAEESGLTGEPLEKLGILASELATNLAKHAADGGEIIVNNISAAENKAVQLISVDRGPGIADIDAALKDGVSETQTLGCGFGALRRLSDAFELNSVPGQGTIIVCTVYQCNKKKIGCRDGLLGIGYLSVPHPKEMRCGDSVSFAESKDVSSILVVDALGHGCEAADVSELASRTFQDSPFDSSKTLLERIHKALNGTRGAVLALAQIFPRDGQLKFLGVGNISAQILSRYTSKGCASSCGIVGGQMASYTEHTHDWDSNSALLMYSDGIKSSLKIDLSRGLSPVMLAAQVYRGFSRQNDDATVLIATNKRESS
jgi:anti-sigma regulatory factor (Ser/Thr protein kinase)